MTKYGRLKPAWPVIWQFVTTEKRRGLLKLTKFLADELPEKWQIYVAPKWLDEQFDLILVHENLGFILLNVHEQSFNEKEVMTSDHRHSEEAQCNILQLQQQCTKLLQNSKLTIQQAIICNSKVAHLFRFGLYMHGMKGAVARTRYQTTDKRQFIIGDDDLNELHFLDALPDVGNVSLIMKAEWAHELASCLTVLDTHENTLRHVSSVSKVVVETRHHQIQNLCEKYQIEYLVHFTRLANLESIMTQGLLSRARLELLPVDQQPQFNDPVRADLQKDKISLSISFPNYRMFYSLRKTQNTQWVVLLIDKSVLWQLDCAFCVQNAASNAMRQIPLSERKKLSSLEQMFADLPDKRRAELHIPNWFPTDPQAEVLVSDRISTSRITRVNFFDKKLLAEWHNVFSSKYSNIQLPQLTIDPEFFNRRCDFKYWKSESATEEFVSQEVQFTIPF